MTTTAASESPYQASRVAGRMLGAALREPPLYMRMLVDIGLQSGDLPAVALERLWSVMLEHWRSTGSLETTLVQDGLEQLLDENDRAHGRGTVDFCLKQDPIRDRSELPGLLSWMRRRVALRRLLDTAGAMMSAVREANADPVAIAERMRARCETVMIGATTIRSATGAELAAIGERLLAEPEEAEQRVLLGFPVIDDILGGGVIKGEPSVIGAATGIGKSTFAAHIALRTLADQHRVLWFSFEATRKKITRILAETRSGFAYPKPGEVSTREQWAALAEAHSWLADQPLYVEDSSGLTVEEVRASISLHAQLYGVDVVLVDYVQDIERSTQNLGRDDLNWAHVSHVLRRAAKDENVALIELSQVGDLEKGQTRLGKENTAGSKKFGRDAFAVVMLEGDRGAANPQLRDVTRLALVKNRQNGRMVDEFMRYDHRTRRLVPCDQYGTPITFLDVNGSITTTPEADDYGWDAEA